MEAASLELSLLDSTLSAALGEDVQAVPAGPDVIVYVNLRVRPDLRPVKLSFQLSPDYPDVVPQVAVLGAEDGWLQRRKCVQIADELKPEMEQLRGEPMLLGLCQAARDKMLSLTLCSSTAADSASSEPTETCFSYSIVQLDHIRDRKRYVGYLRQWATELDLVGRLAIGDRIVLLLWERGCGRNLKTFHSRHKSHSVDVDSAGRPCKERQLQVLCGPSPWPEALPVPFDDWDVVQLHSRPLQHWLNRVAASISLPDLTAWHKALVAFLK